MRTDDFGGEDTPETYIQRQNHHKIYYFGQSALLPSL